jgi:hypothetical protein
VLGALCFAAHLPLGSMRSMERLAVVNLIGVAANGGFAALLLVLAASSAARGEAYALPLWPDWRALVAGAGSRAAAALALANALPVLLNCCSCHQSLHPLLPCLRPYTTKRAQSMVAAALSIACALNASVAL